MLARKTVSIFVIAAFILSNFIPLNALHAAPLLGLPEPGSMVNISTAYEPAMIQGVTVHADNPFLFDFIITPGQSGMQGEALKHEGEKMVRYFMAAMAVPPKDMWVNLSPYENGRIVSENLGQTDMGRDLLAQDYMLKQITASLVYPEKEIGKKFWEKIYAQARERFGQSVNVPVNTFNKVWITSDKAEVFERGQTALVSASHLKVMLEEDYLASKKHGVPSTSAVNAGRGGEIQDVVRSVVLPAIEEEVNRGKNFSSLRQIFNAIILANWYKNNLKNALLNEVYANKNNVKGIDLQDKTLKEKIYARYIQAYKKGVFNYIKETETPQGPMVPRKYFSGGIAEGDAAMPHVTQDAAMFGRGVGKVIKMVVGLDVNKSSQRPITDILLPEIGEYVPVQELITFYKEVSRIFGPLNRDDRTLREDQRSALRLIKMRESMRRVSFLERIFIQPISRIPVTEDQIDDLKRNYKYLTKDELRRLYSLRGTRFVDQDGNVLAGALAVIEASVTEIGDKVDPITGEHIESKNNILLSGHSPTQIAALLHLDIQLKTKGIDDLFLGFNKMTEIESVRKIDEDKPWPEGYYIDLTNEFSPRFERKDSGIDVGKAKLEFTPVVYEVTVKGAKVYVIGRNNAMRAGSGSQEERQHVYQTIRTAIAQKAAEETPPSPLHVPIYDSFGKRLGFVPFNLLREVYGVLHKKAADIKHMSPIRWFLFSLSDSSKQGYVTNEDQMDNYKRGLTIFKGTAVLDAKGELDPDRIAILIASTDSRGDLRDPLSGVNFLNPNWLLSSVSPELVLTAVRIMSILKTTLSLSPIRERIASVTGINNVEILSPKEFGTSVDAAGDGVLMMDDAGNPWAGPMVHNSFIKHTGGYRINTVDGIIYVANRQLSQKKIYLELSDGVNIPEALADKLREGLNPNKKVREDDVLLRDPGTDDVLGYVSREEATSMYAAIRANIGDFKNVFELLHGYLTDEKQLMREASNLTFVKGILRAFTVLWGILKGTPLVDENGVPKPSAVRVLLASFKDGRLVNPLPADAAMGEQGNTPNAIQRQGGIDLMNAGEQTTVNKEGAGVQMHVDAAMIQRIRQEGIDSLVPQVLNMTTVANVWTLIGQEPPKHP